MHENRKSEVVVITGGSAGVGRATAQAYARRGACIGLLARGMDGLQAAAKDVQALGGDALIVQCDVADANAVEDAAVQVEKRFGPIDVWINNAMVSVFSPVILMTAEEYRRVTEVTYLGFIHGTLSALRRMIPRDRGVIVQVGSALAYRGIPLQSAYCAAKHAIQGFVDSLRSELIHDRSNVRITMVQLPALNTPQFGWAKSRLQKKLRPVPPIFQPEVAADAILFAVENNRKEVYVGMPTVKLITADKFLPGVLDHYLAKVGYDSQVIDEQVPPDRKDNLWEPVPGDHGAHGDFDDIAKPHSGQLIISKHRGWLGLAAVAVTAFAFGLCWRK